MWERHCRDHPHTTFLVGGGRPPTRPPTPLSNVGGHNGTATSKANAKAIPTTKPAGKGVSKKPAAKQEPVGTKGTQCKRPAMAQEVPDEETDNTDETKYNQAMLLTGGDTILSKAVMSVDRYQNNAWKDSLTGPVDELLKAEWASVTTCGFGNQKKLKLDSISVINSLLCD